MRVYLLTWFFPDGDNLHLHEYSRLSHIHAQDFQQYAALLLPATTTHNL